MDLSIIVPVYNVQQLNNATNYQQQNKYQKMYLGKHPLTFNFLYIK